MPPARSGIADYSEALVSELSRISELQLFDRAPKAFDSGNFDIAVYQLGNNADHGFVYEMALRYPGVVVMHEANLHHLVADLTIRRGDWDSYIEACTGDFNDADASRQAREYALRARTLAIGPDYDNVPMLRRVLRVSSGAIAHSDYVLSRIRAAGFEGPATTVPHGAWVDLPPSPGQYAGSRNDTRHRLGLDESTPLIGAFGYLKPYKRIAETLRALRRLVRLDPRVKMILGGEPHPELPVEQIIRTLGLDAHVRLLGHTAVEEFSSYINACDVIVNLRHPTVGESSGSLLRAFSAGKPALVSNVGAFAELPDEVCLKVPVGPSEEELIFEYLNLLVSRPEVARSIGAKARAWVEQECSWRIVAGKYEAFLESVVRGGAATEPESYLEQPRMDFVTPAPAERAERAEPPPAPAVPIEPDDIRTWTPDIVSRDYLEQHASRLVRTLEITPPGDPSQSVLEMGCYMQITPALQFQRCYGRVRGCYYGQLGRVDRKTARSESGTEFECLVDHFDAEKDIYPYGDESFDTVLCCELIEHLFFDPMHMMTEVNRILKPGGHLVLTTPNITSLRAVAAVLEGYPPGFFTSYIRPGAEGETEARHNREFSPKEIHHLLTNSGFDVARLDTGPFRDEAHPEFSWIRVLLENLSLNTELRGDGIYALGRKTGPVRERWPAWLYV